MLDQGWGGMSVSAQVKAGAVQVKSRLGQYKSSQGWGSTSQVKAGAVQAVVQVKAGAV